MVGPEGALDLPVLEDTVNFPYTFHTKEPKSANLIFKVFSKTSKAPNELIHVGTAVALLEELSNALGPGRKSFFRDHRLPIIGRETFNFIGTFTVNFLLAKPF